MIRTQIQLTEKQYRQLKRWAARFGISLAEAVRRCIDERIQSEGSASGRAERVREALSVCGKYGDPGGLTDVSD